MTKAWTIPPTSFEMEIPDPEGDRLYVLRAFAAPDRDVIYFLLIKYENVSGEAGEPQGYYMVDGEWRSFFPYEIFQKPTVAIPRLELSTETAMIRAEEMIGRMVRDHGVTIEGRVRG